MLVITFTTVTAAIILAIAVVFKRYTRFANIVFAIGLVSTAAIIFGDSMMMVQPHLVFEWKRGVLISESVMAVAWLLFSLSFARAEFWRSSSRFSRFLVYLSPLFIAYFNLVPMQHIFYSPEFQSERVLFLGSLGYSFNLILLSFSIVSIINLETTLRSSSGKARWGIKYAIVGVGTILAINIFYYSHALLYRSINMYLLPVRSGVVFVALLLIGISLVRHKSMDTEFAVSRKVLFGSVTLMVVGIYLLGLGLAGEGMRYFSPKIRENIAIFLGFAGAILVTVIIISERFRRTATVLINKHFYSQKYDYREQWLSFTQRTSLKHSFDDLLTSIAEGVRDTVGVKDAAIWLKERDSNAYTCAKTLESHTVDSSPNPELIEYLKNKQWILNVQSPNCMDIVSRCHTFISATEASLIIPLIQVNDLLGFIVLKEGLVAYEYNYEDYDLLKTLAKQTTVVISNERLSEELIEAREMEAMGRLSSFILHDLKNAASMLSLIAQNARENMDDPEFQRDTIQAIGNTSEKMKGIIAKLNTLPKKTRLDLGFTDLGATVQQSISHLNLNGNSTVSYKELTPASTLLDREEISKVVVNLVINAVDASGSKGKVEVTVGMENGMCFVRVSDNGCGMSEDFIDNRLFRPFQTTKKKGLGIGLYQCKSIIEAHSGHLSVSSRDGTGTDFTVYLPIRQN